MGDCCRDAQPFRLCSGLRFLGYIMILLVFAIVAVSYYAVIVVAWGPQLLHGGLLSILAFVIVLLFHLLLVLLLWSYFMVVFHDPGAVPVGWQPASKGTYSALENSVILADHIAIDTRESEFSSTEGSGRRPSIRYCSHCQNNKPPRSHHCSVCQRCVLKMDHHCVWVVNCVGARNYKFFLLFLFYTFLETVLDSLALLPHFIKFFGDARNHSGSPGNLAVTFLSFVLNVAFALSLLCFVVMHTSLVLSNTTTIEVYEKKKAVEWKYDLGKRKNFEQVFGSNKLFWFFPLFSKNDLHDVPALHGLDFPTHSDIEV
ncbi:probable protein S-acyltransferase 12 [Dendrobium catenatum]|uniref:S-acyltransferase n=1 Tax=Dendrobium catenatum TaxID=906689 RepID=A0A2I0WBB2_9ASPA|nr:probable protein S-acyltransferase 12 [Dendrobium catenatum]PKU72949.1 putative S-acyltransferase [Dendrobium catenatum]